MRSLHALALLLEISTLITLILPVFILFHPVDSMYWYRSIGPQEYSVTDMYFNESCSDGQCISYLSFARMHKLVAILYYLALAFMALAFLQGLIFTYQAPFMLSLVSTILYALLDSPLMAVSIGLLIRRL
jgi:hypothetical protein